MNIRNVGRGWRLVDAVVLLSLVLLLPPAPALAQPAPLQEEPVSAPSPQAAPQDYELQDPSEDPVDCPDPSRPASAQHLLPYPEQEVGVTYKVGSDRQEYMYYDYSAGALINRTIGPASHSSGTFAWGRGVAVDWNGDGYDEIVEAGRGEENRRYRLTVQAFKYGDTTGTLGFQWWASDGSLNGDQVKYIDIAAGNLLRHSDRRRDVVVALRNDDADLQLLMFTGTGGYYLAPPLGYTDPVGGRETVWYTSVATGDLTGEGFDDNIVTAFKDGAHHLQVLVMRYINNAWQMLAVTRFVDPSTSHGAENVARPDGNYNVGPTRGIDVTTGDVDGDGLDEAIVAFTDAGQGFQVMALGLSAATSGSTPYVLNDEGYYRTEEDTKDPDSVGVAAPDLNGDGIAEILAAFGGRRHCKVLSCEGFAPAQVWRLSYGEWEDDPNDQYDQGSFLKRDLVWKDQAAYDAGDYDFPNSVTIEKVNVDAGQRDQAILAFNAADGNDSIALRVLQEPGDNKSLGIAASANYETGASGNYDVTAIAGDINGDSHWLTYTGVCKQYGISAVDTVLNMPPIWYEKNEPRDHIGAAVGQTVSDSSTRGETTTAKYGASYTIDGSVSIADIIEAGPKFKAEFEGSHGVEKEEKFEISTTLNESTDFETGSTSGLVLQNTVNYRVYVYEDDITGKPVRVRVPAGTSQYYDTVEKWKERQANRGWLPVAPGPRVNLALGKKAKQSSTYSGSDASRAVDGNTDGSWWHYSVSHTESEPGAWWEVDLGEEYPIESVSIWNRTDAVPERLQNYVVRVYDKGEALTWTSPTQTGIAGMPTMVSVHQMGRHLRVQLLGTNYLSLAEVQVWKDLAGVNLALGKPASQSSDYSATSTADKAVDGNTDGDFSHGSVSSTLSEAGAWWQVDLGAEYPIGEVDIWNRTDCCSSLLITSTVKVSYTGTDWDQPPWQVTWHDEVGRPTAVKVGTKGRYVRIQQLVGTNQLSLAEVQVLKGRQVRDYPKALFRDSDLYFTVTNQDGTTEKVSGNLKWDWCSGYMDPDATVSDTDTTKIKDLVAEQCPVKVYSQSGAGTWETHKVFDENKHWTDTWGLMFSAGFEAKGLGVGAEWDVSGGFEKEHTNSLSHSNKTFYQGNAQTYSGWPDIYFQYWFCPYYYVASTTAADGVMQGYTVVDYYVPCIGSACDAQDCKEDEETAAKPALLPQAQPGAPVIESSSHPDPDTWYNASKAAFTWHQPAGDPVTNPSYNWLLDQQPGTVPEPKAQGTKQTDTYYYLADGEWYLHVRAMGPGDQWSDTAHRRIRIDRLAPTVTLALDPPVPTGNQGWYTVPATVTASATDPGSGVATFEISTDGTTWQPYAGPLHFTSDTPPTTIWARASDAAGHAAEPVSATLAVDLTPPISQGLGVCLGGVCGGGVSETTSRVAGMELQIDGGSWTSADSLGEWQPAPEPATPWIYAALLDVGHGHHIVYGRAADGAGNLEAPHKIGEETLYPTASPDLSQSAIAIEPAVARPGETVTVILDLRNGGFGEAYVAFTATLPAGLTPAEGALTTLDNSITYDPATGVITWPVELLWSGDSLPIQFEAVVAGGLAASTLTARLDAHGSWPNIEMLTPEEQQQFRDYEDSVTASADLKIDPQLPAGQDVTAPHVRLTLPAGAQLPASARVDLALAADADARWMYLREWTLDPATGAWTVAQSSGWLPYTPSLTWTLSDGAGIKYIGAWVADAAKNVSRLDEGSLAFTNRLIEEDLLAGQRRQYRFPFDGGVEVFNLLTSSGQAELYAWLPGHGGPPDYVAEGSDFLKTLGFPVVLEGLYQLEAIAGQDTVYTLLYATPPEDPRAASATDGASQAAAPPERALTMTTPLTAGAGAAPELNLKLIYLPIVYR